MKITVMLVFLLCILAACTGPVLIARDEGQAIKTSYTDPGLSELSVRYHPALNDIYHRYESAGIDFYPDGLGFVDFADNHGKTLHYLLVEVRPRNIHIGEMPSKPEAPSHIGEAQTKPTERFSEVFRHHFEKNLRYLKAEDLWMDGVDGLAFGVYWPVRDLSKCDAHGGFLEYMIVYFHKDDFVSLIEKRKTLSEAMENGEVVTSLDQKPPRAVRVKEVE
jgi:hypothetical protein